MKILKIIFVLALLFLVCYNFLWTPRSGYQSEVDKNVDRGYSESLKNVEPELDIKQQTLPKLEVINDPNSLSLVGGQENQEKPAKETEEKAKEELKPALEEEKIKLSPSEDFDFNGGRGSFEDNNGAYNF